MTTPVPQTAHAADLQLVADLARSNAIEKMDPKKGDYLDAAPFVILRNGSGDECIAHLDGTLPPPSRRTGHVTLQDAASFITYVNMHHNGTPIYATPNPAQFLAILNDHQKVVPGHRDFRATLKLDFSDEWKAWIAHNGHDKAFPSTEAFAEFLEVNAPDIVNPDAGTFRDLALNFHVNESVSYSKVQRLEDGQVQLTYNHLVDGQTTGGKGGIIKMPTRFSISVPVFRSAAKNAFKYTCEASFRYRLRDSKVTIWYELIRPKKVLDDAFRDLWGEIAEELGVPVFYGMPA